VAHLPVAAPDAARRLCQLAVGGALAGRSSATRCTPSPPPSRSTTSASCCHLRHLVFNSFAQLERFRSLWEPMPAGLSIGLRVNPSTPRGTPRSTTPVRRNRASASRAASSRPVAGGVEGLHFHTLFEQFVQPLARTVAVFEKQFGTFLTRMKWLNLAAATIFTAKGTT